jgi:hypothetical protein
MIKHIGKHNNKKVVLIFREIPEENHMCLVCYSDSLPRMIHDEVMRVLESAQGQSAQSLSDPLFRSILPDGRNTLESLHRDGLLKKVPTNQVLVTPTTNSSVRLDELNSILNEMAKGADATKRLAELDSQQGMSTKPRKAPAGRDLGDPVANTVNPTVGALTDQDLAVQRQAANMKADAERLLKEAEALIAEAEQLDPITKNEQPTKKKIATKSKKDQRTRQGSLA